MAKTVKKKTKATKSAKELTVKIEEPLSDKLEEKTNEEITTEEKEDKKKVAKNNPSVKKSKTDSVPALPPKALSKEQRLAKLKQIAEDFRKREEERGLHVKVGLLKEDHMNGVGTFPIIPTGILTFDKWAGGIPTKCHLMMAGDPEVGKTSTALSIAAKFQQHGYIVAFGDAEFKFDKAWAEKLGVNTDELILGQFDIMESMFDWMIKVVEHADLIILDSLTALATKGQKTTSKGADKEIADDTMALQARTAFKYFRKVTAAVAQNHATVLLIGQQYELMEAQRAGMKKTGGGRGSQYYNLLNLTISRLQADEELRDFGYVIKFKADKSSYTGGPPNKSSCETMFFYEKGFDTVYEVVKFAKESGYFGGNNMKTTYTLGDIELSIRGSKLSKIIEWVNSNPEIYTDIYARLQADGVI